MMINEFKGCPQCDDDVVTGWTSGNVSVGWENMDKVFIEDQHGNRVLIDGGVFESLLIAIASIRDGWE